MQRCVIRRPNDREDTREVSDVEIFLTLAEELHFGRTAELRPLFDAFAAHRPPASRCVPGRPTCCWPGSQSKSAFLPHHLVRRRPTALRPSAREGEAERDDSRQLPDPAIQDCGRRRLARMVAAPGRPARVPRALPEGDLKRIVRCTLQDESHSGTAR
ncbi:hypothetical protein [Nonomuraea diastatica]|uniref:Uncharacterized protein n=1 Tax=Nonomuraea diastatica TaxID=1848329 RepID=A0A4V2YFC0_9ACTN|nr:hypothetical protein [Nonomuraea diastatica]TDD22577.1 hypothetical protein E1294_11290 [Nonomuraea diastatica]